MLKPYTLYSILYHRYVSKTPPTKVCDMSGGRKLMLVATGPSANEFWNDQEIQRKYSDCDLVIMNRTIYKMRDEVFRLKPRYLAVADPIYWRQRNNSGIDQEILNDTCRQFEDVINSIDWECYLITIEAAQIHLHNDHVHIIRINETIVTKDEPVTYRYYASNDCVPDMHNVGLLTLYFGITFGYKEIGLIGMDFDFFKGLYCDENCEVGEIQYHQYDDENTPVIHEVYHRESCGEINGSLVANCLCSLGYTLGTCGQLGIYARHQGCKIINYSLHSMIDCYEKRKL